MALSREELDNDSGSVFSDYTPPSTLQLASVSDAKPPVQQATEGIINATVVEGENTGANVTPDPHPSIPRTRDIIALDPELSQRLGIATEQTKNALQDKMDADRRADQSGAMKYHRAQAERANAAEAHELGNLPSPWDAEKKSAEMIRGPFESFGSFASILALAASAFTKQPALNALSASAAAMTAIHQQDAVAYERAYTAWKDNTELVQKRFNMEKQLFDNASHLFDTDQALWKSKLVANAARFGDQHMLNLLNAGLDSEAIKLWSDRSRAFESSTKAQKEIEEMEARRKYVNSSMEAIEKEKPDWTPEQRALYGLTVTQTANARTLDERLAAQILQQKMKEKGELSSDDLMQFQRDFRAGRYGRLPTSEQALVEQIMQDPDLTPEEKETKLKEVLAARKTVSAAGNTTLTPERQRAQDIQKAREKWKAEGLPDDEIARRAADLERQLKTQAAGLTGAGKEKVASQITRFDMADKVIDKVEALLKKHKAMTGLGGRITRPAEVVTNWFGSDETDRAQFKSYIDELREWGPRLINEANSRPLSAEEKRIGSVVPGLDMGDTTINTAKRLLELQKLFRTMRENLRKRYEGTWSPETTTVPAPTTAPTENKPWTPPASDRPVQ